MATATAQRTRAPATTAGRSRSRVYPAVFLDQAGEALSDCSTYRRTTDDRTTTRTASLIQTPNLGDQTLAWRSTGPDGDVDDRVYVVSGHNLITVVLRDSTADYSADPLIALAEGVLDNLGH